MHKHTNCPNCQHEFSSKDQFCPACGQSRANYNTSFTTILKDYIDEVFGIDSKLKHTYISFLLKPQFLTEEFLKGRRQHYVHPIRLYLICSIFFIFIFNHILVDTHSFKIDIDKFFPKESNIVTSDSSGITINVDDKKINLNEDVISSSTSMEKDDFFIEKEDNKVYEKLVDFIRNSEVVNSQTIKDSLGITEWYKVKLIKQARYFYEEKGVTFFQAVLENIPIAIMLLVPLFALYLKVLYIRNKENLYIQHLIFSVHLHAFTLFIFGLILLLSSVSWGKIGTINTALIIYWFIIILLMLKNFYKQKWGKTILKLTIAASLHSIMIFWVILVELVISLLIF